MFALFSRIGPTARTADVGSRFECLVFCITLSLGICITYWRLIENEAQAIFANTCSCRPRPYSCMDGLFFCRLCFLRLADVMATEYGQEQTSVHVKEGSRA